VTTLYFEGRTLRFILIVSFLTLLAATLPAQKPAPYTGPHLTKSEIAQVDSTTHELLRRYNVPGLSLAIVRNGELAYRQAYGFAELPTADPSMLDSHEDPLRIDATTATRFALGSVSKEFTTAAILLLADRGKLSLDDPVSKFLPHLTSANQITVRQLLNHTSGYSDYFLQEYIPARTQLPTTVDAILKTWGERPLDFSPGQDWQYSSTNYVIAGRIVEIASGEPYHKFLEKNILRPVGIYDAFSDGPEQQTPDAVGYYRFALGTPRRAPVEGRNWLFAMADLQMTATDVARWDISVVNQSLLSPASYEALRAETKAASGRPTGYSLGFFVTQVPGTDGQKHWMLHHPGEVSGFRAHNFILPDLKAAVVILTNAEYSGAVTELAESIQSIVGVESTHGAAAATGESSAPSATDAARPSSVDENTVETRAHRIVNDLTQGKVDRSEFAPDANATFSRQAVSDIRSSLAPLGPLERVRLEATTSRGGTKHHALTLIYPHRQLQIAEYELPDGTIEQFMIDTKPQATDTRRMESRYLKLETHALISAYRADRSVGDGSPECRPQNWASSSTDYLQTSGARITIPRLLN
jgi:D-alanyl-D-alanine carboxypeptidase